MPITLSDLTVNFAHLDRGALLSEWRWLIGANQLPILITAMGTAFVQNTEVGTVSLLDPGEGKLYEIAASAEEFNRLLADREFVYSTLLVEAFVRLHESGRVLGAGQVFGFIKPPVLGGSFNMENLEPTNLELHFSLLGQIHQKVKGLPEGTAISQVSIS